MNFNTWTKAQLIAAILNWPVGYGYTNRTLGVYNHRQLKDWRRDELESCLEFLHAPPPPVDARGMVEILDQG